jgi:HD-GYP domain-containing protein (c-di-GMP phosphodiesterase class II)
MRAIPLSELRPGAVLAGPVRSPRGLILLQPNVVVTERHIDLMHRHGLELVVAEDVPDVPDKTEDVVERAVRTQASARLGDIHRALEDVVEPLRVMSPTQTVDYLGAGMLRDRVVTSAARLGVDRALDSAVNTLVGAEVRVRANAARARDSGLAVHALDTTVVALELGRRLHLSKPDLRHLAAGCLLHDLGMLAVPPDLLGRRRLAPEERARMRLHPLIGYELLRGLRPGEIVANHVAYQHHERQDGLGYPRGLRGTNRVGRTATSRPSSNGRIVLEAEIVAVADVYVALSARRPHRPPLPMRHVVAALRRMAGRHLNRELVAVLIEMLGVYPLGASVVVRDGQYARWRGIVSRVHPEAPDRPTVRLFVGAKGEPVGPVEVDLRQAEGAVAPLAQPLTRYGALAA